MPRNNFCTHCGAMLDPGARFCTSCGRPVPPVEGADATVAIPRPAPAETPVQPEAPAVAAPTRPTTNSRSSRHELSQRTIVIACVCVIAASAAAIAASLLLSARPASTTPEGAQTQTSEQPAQEEETPSADDQADQSTTSPTTTAQEEDDSSAADAAFHDTVKTYYDALPGYSDHIAGVATTFNADYLKDDLATRQAHYQEASALLSQIVSQRSALASIEAPADSEWEAQRQQVIECYDYSAERLQCMVDAWAIDVGYATPSDHQAEILAPIQAGNDTDNRNLAKKEYEALYPQIQL